MRFSVPWFSILSLQGDRLVAEAAGLKERLRLYLLLLKWA